VERSDQRDRLQCRPPLRRGDIPSARRLGQDLLARLLYGGRAPIASAHGDADRRRRRNHIGAIARMSRGVRADVADRSVSSLPQLPLLLLIIYPFRDALKKMVGSEVIFIMIVAVIGGSGGCRWPDSAPNSWREKEFVGPSCWVRAVSARLSPHPAERDGSDYRVPERSTSPCHHCRVDAFSWGSGFRPTLRPGDASSTTPRTIWTSRRTGRSFRER
jgi:hypothetical protein